MLNRLAACAGVVLGTGTVLADFVDLAPSRDNTIYEDSLGAFSNALGSHVFVGKTAVGQVRRALVRFDIAGAIPAGSTITDVKLTLNMSMTTALDSPVSLNRSLKDWGEGTSNAGEPGGMGALATPGDATWLHTFFDGRFWGGPGGAPGSDYTAAPSATATVGNAQGPYTWNATPALLADVQNWLDNPAANFGWFIMGDETADTTAKRFDSRENSVPANRPALHIIFVPPACYANCDHSTTAPCLNVLDFTCFLNAFASGTLYANCDLSTTPPALNVLDFTCFLNRFAAGCSAC